MAAVMRNMCRLVAVLIIACAAGTPAPSAQSGSRAQPTVGQAMAIRMLSERGRLSDLRRPVPITPAGATIRVRLKLEGLGAGAWKIEVHNLRGELIQTIEPSRFVDGEYWTHEIHDGSAQIALTGDMTGVHVEADAYAVEQTLGQPQGIIGGQDESTVIPHPLTPAEARRAAPSVAQLQFMNNVLGAFCSGFLVGKDLLITNNHCIRDNSQMATARVTFGASSNARQRTGFDVIDVLATSFALDFSLLRLSGDASTKFGRLYLGGVDAALAMRLIIVQHPDGGEKKAAYPPHCLVGQAMLPNEENALTDFGHTCDTKGGSSGAPVIQAGSPTVVGLHHWTRAADTTGAYNQAVRITQIAKDLERRTHSPRPSEKRLPRAVFDEVTRPLPPTP